MLLGLVEAAAQALSGQQWLEKCSVQELGFHICFTAALLLFWVCKCVKMNPNMTPAPANYTANFMDDITASLRGSGITWTFLSPGLSVLSVVSKQVFVFQVDLISLLFKHPNASLLLANWMGKHSRVQTEASKVFIIYFFSVFQFPTLFVVTATCSICLTYAVFLFLSLLML